MAGIYVNISTGPLSPEVTGLRLISVVILVFTSIFGLIMNSLYIWVLKFRMTQSVSTTWFFHFIITNQLFSLNLPIVAAYILRNPLWIFGAFLCKMINTVLTLCKNSTVYFLMVISFDRYFLVLHPVWWRKFATIQRASMTCFFFWGVAILVSSLCLVFCNVEEDKNVTTCCSEFTYFWNGSQLPLDPLTKWGLFFSDLIANFLLPFLAIMYCYLQIAFKIKHEQLTNSTRPYKLIGLVLASFFICWTPYYIRKGMLLETGIFQEEILQALVVLTTCFACVNSCLTPILYLFIVDSFNKEFKKAVFSLLGLERARANNSY